MIYNVLAWTKGKRERLEEDDSEKLICDVWHETEEHAFLTLRDISTYSSRGVILNFKTNKIIAEHTGEEIIKLT